MGPSLAIIVLMFAVLAVVAIGSLLLMPGWKSSLALFAVYTLGLASVSVLPHLIEGQMNRAALGLAWLALVLAGVVRIAMLLLKRRSSR